MIITVYRYQSVSLHFTMLDCRSITNIFIIYHRLHVEDMRYNIKKNLKEIRSATVERIHMSPYRKNWWALPNGVKETGGSVK